MRIKRLLLFVIIIAFGAITANAQFIEDALRFSQPNGIVTPRSASLGISYLGIADDFAATLYNPAGLSLVTNTELSVGLGFQRNSNTVKFSNFLTDFHKNDAYFSHLGLVAPFKTKLGNAAIGLGYILESNYKNTYEYSGFNAKNTMIAHQAQFGTRNYEDNWAYHIWLANKDLKTPITDSLTQQAFITESGGLHNIIGGAGFDVSPSISAGLNIIAKFGEYNYLRNYSEFDSKNKYNKFDTNTWNNLDFKSLVLDEAINQQIFGITASLGIQARIAEFMRVGATIKFPTFYHVNEEYSIYARSEFDDGWKPNPYDPKEPSDMAYNITSPFIYSAGFSFNANGLTLTAGVEYFDATQLSFSDANGEQVTNINEIRRYFNRLNINIAKELVGQVRWGVGVEWDLRTIPVVVRGSLQSTTSPYTLDIPEATDMAFALGAGVYIAKNIRVDGMFRWNKFNQIRTNYGTSENGSLYELSINPLNIGLQLTFRF